MLGKIEEIIYYKSNPDNDVRVIWIDRNENDSMNALFVHLKSFIPNLTQREFSVLIPQFQQLKDDFIEKVGYDVMYPFKTLNDHLTSLSLYACDYRPSYERVELFKRLRVSEIISPEQGEHLLHLIRGSSLSGDEKKQRVLFDSQSTEIHRCITPELPDSGYSNSGYTPCTSHSNAV